MIEDALGELAPVNKTRGSEEEEGLGSTLEKDDNKADDANNEDQLNNVPAQKVEAQDEKQAPI